MKKLDLKKVLVTGGAGFLGNHIVRRLLENNSQVYVLDKFLRNNKLENITNDNLIIINGDCSNSNDLKKISKDVDTVFHLAADPEVNLSITNTESLFTNNIFATFTLLEWIKNSNCKHLVFTSTSTIYGEPSLLPTPETYSPLSPISFYGGSKLACEDMISSYSNSYNIKSIIVRLANIIGPDSDHGIIPDMIKKIQHSSYDIEILGDGKQSKSYLHVDDCITGIFTILENNESLLSTYNLGSETKITVNEIVDIILEEYTLKDIKKKFTGGIEEGRGWKGDVKTMLLDIQKLKKLGWSPTLNSKEAVIKTVKNIHKMNN